MRRIVYQHTAGAYPGLRQILAVETEHEGTPVLVYLHSNEGRRLDPGPLPDRLAPIKMPFDGRKAAAMRLKTSDKWVLYVEAK